MTRRPGRPVSKHDIQIEKWNSRWKTFHRRKPKKNNKFLVFLPIISEGIFETFKDLLSLLFVDIYIKMGENEPLVEPQLESTTA